MRACVRACMRPHVRLCMYVNELLLRGQKPKSGVVWEVWEGKTGAAREDSGIEDQELGVG